MTDTGSKSLRADAQRTVTAILQAADRVLWHDPSASLEQIASVAGVTRTTVYRRFSSREALLSALQKQAIEHFYNAFEASSPETAPPLVALHRLTVNVIRTKANWAYSLGRLGVDDPAAVVKRRTLLGRLDTLFKRAQQEGIITEEVDLDWAQRAYRAMADEAVNGLIAEAANPLENPVEKPAVIATNDAELDRIATLIIRTLLKGIGARQASI